MANIGESLTTRLARERLEAINIFLPVFDSVREKLRAQQEEQVNFKTGTEELFKPVTAVTGKVLIAIKGRSKDEGQEEKGLLQAIEQMTEQIEAAQPEGAVAEEPPKSRIYEKSD